MKRFFSRLLRRLKPDTRPKAADKPARPKKKEKAPKPAPPDPFLRMTDLYAQRLAKHWCTPMPASDDSADEIAVLITPWLETAVPMFALEIALLLRKQGARVRLLMDDTEVCQNAGREDHRSALRQLAGIASIHVQTTDVNARPDVDGTAEAAAAQRICDHLAVWWERGETGAAAFFERNPEAVARTAAHLAKIRQMLKALPIRRVLVPGGFFGLSAVYCRVAQDLGISFSTFDSNALMLLVSHDAIAGHRKDLMKVVARIEQSLSDADWTKVQAIADDEFQRRLHGRDVLGMQAGESRPEGVERYDIVVPLNLRWDAAALDCELAYPTCLEWLESLIGWVEKDGRFSICLREHPIGRLAIARSAEDYGPLLERFKGMGRRLRYIRPEEEINTYDLLRACKLVLPYTSTVGIEAAMLGIPVITHTTVYYRDMGFSWPAKSPDDYLRLVAGALEGSITVSEMQKRKAQLAYYVTQRASFLLGDFNPNPEPYLRWVARLPEELMASTGAHELATALLTGEDVPILVHRANMSATP